MGGGGVNFNMISDIVIYEQHLNEKTDGYVRYLEKPWDMRDIGRKHKISKFDSQSLILPVNMANFTKFIEN